MTVDNRLSFDPYLDTECKKVSHKLHAPPSVSNYISQRIIRIIMKAFITSQFCYYPLVWICHSRKLNNKINSLPERALRLVSKDRKSTFEELLIPDKSVNVHRKNLQILATACIRYNMELPIAL